MKVKELIKELLELPEDADIILQGGDYQDNIYYAEEVDYQERSSWGRSANTVLLR